MLSKTGQRRSRHLQTWLSPIILLLALAGEAMAQVPDDLADLQHQLATQEAVKHEQSELLKKQQETLARLLEQLEALKHRMANSSRPGRHLPLDLHPHRQKPQSASSLDRARPDLNESRTQLCRLRLRQHRPQSA